VNKSRFVQGKLQRVS